MLIVHGFVVLLTHIPDHHGQARVARHVVPNKWAEQVPLAPAPRCPQNGYQRTRLPHRPRECGVTVVGYAASTRHRTALVRFFWRADSLAASVSFHIPFQRKPALEYHRLCK